MLLCDQRMTAIIDNGEERMKCACRNLGGMDMPITQAVRRPGAVSKVYVYIDDLGINGMQGRLFFYGGDEMSFNGMLEMLKTTESVLDRYSMPQPVFQYREFDGGTKAKTHKEPRDRA
ncbi:MAG: hypothetical protein P4M02_06640, partial [Clostridia bacterium]|nr:hypothetical protein [Clostridia bacterium]